MQSLGRKWQSACSDLEYVVSRKHREMEEPGAAATRAPELNGAMRGIIEVKEEIGRVVAEGASVAKARGPFIIGIVDLQDVARKVPARKSRRARPEVVGKT
jgi:hypothetical protein